jgi:hypothetical protein
MVLRRTCRAFAPISATWAAAVEPEGPPPPPSMAWTDVIGLFQIEWRQEVPAVWT